jgi:hypothetical protein
MNIALIGNAILRSAIQRNLVSFPSQVPGFMRRQSGDAQERIVQLYFVRGWPVRSICDRYCLSKAMVQKILSEWRIRAVAAGYIQDIHPEVLDFIASEAESALEIPQQLTDELIDELPGLEPAFTPAEPGWPLGPPPQPDHTVSAAGGL